MPLRVRHLVHFTAALYVRLGILYYTFVLLFALLPMLNIHAHFLFLSLAFSFPLFIFLLLIVLIHIRSTSPNRIMVILLSHCASLRLNNIYISTLCLLLYIYYMRSKPVINFYEMYELLKYRIDDYICIIFFHAIFIFFNMYFVFSLRVNFIL